MIFTCGRCKVIQQQRDNAGEKAWSGFTPCQRVTKQARTSKPCNGAMSELAEPH